MYNVKTNFGSYDVKIEKCKYSNGNLALQLFSPEEGPFARLTVNLVDGLKNNMAYVDTNNCPWAEQFIQENKLGKDTGVMKASGWCVYPLYEFNLDVIE